MADFVQSLDPSKLLLGEILLAFALSPFSFPSYNLPVLLYGHLVSNSQEPGRVQLFTGLLACSFPLDIVWMARNHQNGFLRFLTVLFLLLKIPTTLVFAIAARQQGAQFGGIGLGGEGDGATVWSMPGGFSSSGREGYQTVDDVVVPTQAPVSLPVHSVVPQQPPKVAPGVYQSV